MSGFGNKSFFDKSGFENISWFDKVVHLVWVVAGFLGIPFLGGLGIHIALYFIYNIPEFYFLSSYGWFRVYLVLWFSIPLTICAFIFEFLRVVWMPSRYEWRLENWLFEELFLLPEVSRAYEEGEPGEEGGYVVLWETMKQRKLSGELSLEFGLSGVVQPWRLKRAGILWNWMSWGLVVYARRLRKAAEKEAEEEAKKNLPMKYDDSP